MRTRPVWRVLLTGALAVGTLVACGDDDDEPAATDTSSLSTTISPAAANELTIEMVDYGYQVTGSLKAGLATINSRNTGKEWHMAGFGKLKEGATAEAVAKALQAAGESEGGNEQQDPTAEFIEKEIHTPGHILQPGNSQSLTVDVLEPGNYVMICFLPTEGEGTPHFAKGMVNGFTVEAGESGAKEPASDAAITLADESEAAGVPTDLKSGKRTFKVTATGSKGKDFFIGQVNAGKKFDDFDTYFSEFEKEGGPAKGIAAQAPGSILGSTFQIDPGQTIWMTVDIDKGQTLFINTTNPDDDAEDSETVDKVVTVNVT